MITLTIEKDVPVKGKKKTKTRRFSTLCVGFVLAPFLFDGGDIEAEQRPVFVSVAAKDTSLRPFVANFKAGRRAEMTGHNSRGWNAGSGRMRLLKKAGYQNFSRKAENFTMTTFYLPQVFRHDVGLIDRDKCSFVSLPPLWWAKKQRQVLSQDETAVANLNRYARRVGLFDDCEKSIVGLPKDYRLTEDDLIRMVPLAVHYMAMMDMRVRFPLVNEYGFAIRMYLAALAIGVASTPVDGHYETISNWHKHTFADGFFIQNQDEMGFEDGVVTDVSQKRLGEFLAQQTKSYQEEIK
jgi:hypothetical protein